MSVGQTCDDGTISIFTRDGVTVHGEQDVQYVMNTGNIAFHWCSNEVNGNLGTHPKKHDKLSDKRTVYMT
jgi:hypothetical protein